MKIAVTARGQGLDGGVDPRFGRCEWLVMVDSETGEVLESLANPGASEPGGGGVRTAALIADRRVEVVIASRCGPGAFRALQAAGVEVFTGASGTVREAVSRFQRGELVRASGATVQPRAGMGWGRRPGPGTGGCQA